MILADTKSYRDTASLLKTHLFREDLNLFNFWNNLDNQETTKLCRKIYAVSLQDSVYIQSKLYISPHQADPIEAFSKGEIFSHVKFLNSTQAIHQIPVR